jgi:hypothetical protein
MKPNPSRLRVLALAVLILTLALPLAAAQADSGGRFDVKFTGVIESISENQWIVAGQEIGITGRTEIELAGGTKTPGQWADIMMERTDDSSWSALWITLRPPEARLKGPVLAEPASGIGAWQIAGQTIMVDATTRIDERLGPVNEGYWVEVYYIQDPAGVPQAVRIRGTEPLQFVHMVGAIQVFGQESWTLSGVRLAVDEATLVAREPRLNLLAHAEATLGEDGILLAQHCNPVWIEPGGARPELSFTGQVQALPPSGLNGFWTIDGRVVLVTPTTTIHQVKDLVEVGATVHVLAWEQGQQIVAIQITVLGPSDGLEQIQYRWWHGPVEERPPQGLFGPWEIGGQQVQVTHQTRVQGAGQAHIGAPAEVGAVRRENGETIGTWLRARSGPH